MNKITAKTYSQEQLNTNINISALIFSKTALYTATLTTSVLLSALGLVYLKEETRALFTTAAKLQQTQTQLEIKQSQLLLEEKNLLTQGKIETMARDQLQMETPTTTLSVSVV